MDILEGVLVAARVVVLSVHVLLEAFEKPEVVIGAIGTSGSVISFAALEVTLAVTEFVLLLLLN